GQNAKYGIGLSANVSVNTIDDNVYSYIHDAGRITAPHIALTAVNDTGLQAFAASASVVLPSETGGNQASIAGSYSKNQLTGDTKAFIRGQNTATAQRLDLAPDASLLVNADRKGAILAVTAGFGVAVERSPGSQSSP